MFGYWNSTSSCASKWCTPSLQSTIYLKICGW